MGSYSALPADLIMDCLSTSVVLLDNVSIYLVAEQLGVVVAQKGGAG